MRYLMTITVLPFALAGSAAASPDYNQAVQCDQLAEQYQVLTEEQAPIHEEVALLREQAELATNKEEYDRIIEEHDRVVAQFNEINERRNPIAEEMREQCTGMFWPQDVIDEACNGWGESDLEFFCRVLVPEDAQ